jgi:hypothetical protein
MEPVDSAVFLFDTESSDLIEKFVKGDPCEYIFEWHAWNKVVACCGISNVFIFMLLKQCQ